MASGRFRPKEQGRSMTGVRMIATAGTYFRREDAKPMQESNDEMMQRRLETKKSRSEQRSETSLKGPNELVTSRPAAYELSRPRQHPGQPHGWRPKESSNASGECDSRRRQQVEKIIAIYNVLFDGCSTPMASPRWVMNAHSTL